MPPARPTALPFATACLGIALYAVTDAVMKGLAIAIGSYTTLVWRLAVGGVLTGTWYALGRTTWPGARVVRIHFGRSILIAVMAVGFFWGIARVPLAEAVALSFIAPLIALALAAAFLGERVRGQAVLASLLGLAGVGVILAGRIGGTHSPDTLRGMAAVLVSAVFYAANLVVARHQAQLARPVEIAAFQHLFVLALLLPAAPVLLHWPAATHWPAIVLAALLSVVSLLLLSWAYARAEAQVLLSVEYTAFVWAALMGWWVFGERLTLATLAGTALIVVGCLLAAGQRASLPAEIA